MSILNVQNVSHSFGGRQILENVSFRLLNGEHVGLIGANGEGKSTFLNIITGKLAPEEGKVEWCNRITTGYLDQHTSLEKGKSIKEVLQDAFHHLFDLEKEMMDMYEKMGDCSEEEMDHLMKEVGEIQDILDHNGFYMIDAKINEVAKGLGLLDIGLDKDVTQLSGGQRSKVLLSKLLLENPMILILDEPTNYLDEEHIRWLTTFLSEYQNAFILVSHDIPFLNAVTNVIYHVENCILTRYAGDYHYFEEQYAMKKRQQEAAYNKQQKEIEDLEDFIARNKARVATRNMAHSRQKKLDKMDLISKPKTKIKPVFEFMEARTPGRVIFEVKDLVIGYDDPLTTPFHMELERNKKIAIKGVNGLGKTTLLKTLLGIIPALSGQVEVDPFVEIGFFEQEEHGNTKTALQHFWDHFPGLTNGEVRAALAKCGLTTDHIESGMCVLSGGEQAKVRLALIMNKPCNVLVLDEPTNHLDVDAKEELQRALKAYHGTIILVSHDPDFYMDIVDEVINLEDYTTKVL
ncbi:MULTISPECIES: ABC-F family ATP-binding cassette domain-containing protein [Bacillota]|uniref:ABC-F family ATP-binding cassette domain-containing protein n=2 Tax=Amedibacillus TaxID=2749846 RepID=A0A7G9GM78_9FIRM|nr:MULTISPECIES: ABC-F family ATP-binding cassette domain-containing protein [Bacillota]QNM11910.1 ABC-F family ATP-binding cassette domain-containing protein [[Eubacterium] hominis]MCH4287341.1 ATP-binding cassette domain-containing protein [Amedibacillus hominis]RGB50900.1 ABC transporter ATP-binding protein [Absiella sp. AM22-9]RGB56387.1 ABC transporter ATP-binding protein [Absiella sp. AM10-20]RGB62486.1 ABC transporter ATP-binding protein [Absiella sp. AM09-45]